MDIICRNTDEFQDGDMEITFTKDETEKIDLLEKLVKEHVDLSAF